MDTHVKNDGETLQVNGEFYSTVNLKLLLFRTDTNVIEK